ncbi:MAG TPA: cytochrome c3 family protein [Syntrophobacteria bacterium]|nr:cytochrome c3 family protein [Syntrophobacteria bacterium]
MQRARMLVWVGMITAGLLLLAVGLKAQPEDILLNDHSVFTNRQRPAVAFPHMSHINNGIECKTCHHRFQGGKNVLDEMELQEGAEGIKCATCHKEKPGFRLSPDLDASKRNLQQAFHRECMGCHRQLTQEGKKSGPVTCGQCHPWKKASQS